MAHRGAQRRETTRSHSPAWRTPSHLSLVPEDHLEKTPPMQEAPRNIAKLQGVTAHKPIRFATPLPILPMTDSDRPPFRLFQKPEEPPPGLEAIRAWLRKPRPRLAHALSWIPYLLSGIPEAWKFARKNYGPATARLKQIAARAAPVARAVARFGPVAAAGVRLARLANASIRAGHEFVTKYRAAVSAFRDPHGRPAQRKDPAGVEAPAHSADDTSIEAETGAPKTLSSLRWLGGLFRSDQPTGLNLSREPAEARDPEPAPEPRQVAPAGPLSSDGAGKTPTRPAAPGDEPHADPPHRTPPGDAPANRPPAQNPPNPVVAPPPDPAPDPGVRASPPPSAAAPAPALEVDWERRLKGLPKVLHPPVKALSERPGSEILQPLIFDICRLREWTTAGQLARWLSMHRGMLVHRHLRPMLEAGVLELKYPDRPSSPRQAYRARRIGAAQSN